MQPDKRTLELVDQVRALPGVIALRFEEEKQAWGKWKHGETGKWRPPRPRTVHRLLQLKRKNDPDPQLLALFDRLYQEESTAKDEA